MPTRAACLVLCLVSATAASHAQDTVRPSEPDRTAEAFVIEASQTRYRFENDGTGTRETTARVRIQSEAGVQQWGQLVLGYNAATERLDIRYVRVIKADGTVVTAPASAVQELAPPVQLEAPIYTDFRQKHVTVPSLRPGETLEFATVTTIHTPLAAGHFWIEHDFERHLVVLDEQLEVDVPAGRPLIVRTEPGDDAMVEERGGRHVYRWSSRQLTPTATTLEDIDRILEEEAERQPSVRITSFRSWAEVGAWYAGLERDARAPTPEIRAKALELTANAATDREKLQALYDYVAPNFRYVSISLGMGRYQPRAAADVLRDQYGDCKDKHTLLASLMEVVGLRASTVLIGSARTLDPEFPSPSQFDHVSTRAEIAGEPVWMDVTTEVAPFRMLAAPLRDKQALVVSGFGRLEQTPSDPPMPNTSIQEVDGTVDATGALTARVKMAMRGDLELILRTVFRGTPQSAWGELVEGLNQTWAVAGEVRNWQVSDPASTREPFSVEYDVTAPRFASAAGGTARVTLPLLKIDLPEQEATEPLELGSPLEIQSRLRLRFADGYTARAPLPVAVDRDYGEFRASYDVTGDLLTVERLLRTRARTIPAERSGDYTSFRRLVGADAAQQLALSLPASAAAPAASVETADAAAASEDLLRRALEAIRAGQTDQGVADLQRLVAREPRHQSAWSVLGAALVLQRRMPDAIDAFETAIAVNPFDGMAHGAVARLYIAEGRNADAEAALLKQLEITPLDVTSTALLGEQYVRTKRYDDAIVQYERVATLDPDNALLHAQRGQAYLHADRIDEALAAFDRAVSLSPAPVTWNNVAYYLSEKGVHLDRAQQYAESAVASIAAESRNLTIARTEARDLGIVSSLAAYWDTLGWVLFARGDYEGAERFVGAAWRVSQSAVMGDHLAQIHEKRGRRDRAVATYAAALSAGTAQPGTRERLSALVGEPAVEGLVAKHRADLVSLRTVAVKAAGTTGIAEFFVLLGADGAEEASFISGDEALRAMAPAVRAADYGRMFPDDTPARILRRAVLSCGEGQPACDLVLLRAGDAATAGAAR